MGRPDIKTPCLAALLSAAALGAPAFAQPVTISNLPAAASVAATDNWMVEQGGTNCPGTVAAGCVDRHATSAQLLAYVQSGLTLGSIPGALASGQLSGAYAGVTGVGTLTGLTLSGAEVIDASGGTLLTLGNGAGATPDTTVLAFDNTYSSTPGANAKLILYGAGGSNVFGLGVSASSLDLLAPSGNQFGFYVAGAEVASIGDTGLLDAAGGFEDNGTAGVTHTCSGAPSALTITGGIVTAVTC